MILFKLKLTGHVFKWSPNDGLQPVGDNIDDDLLVLVGADVYDVAMGVGGRGRTIPVSMEVPVYEYLHQSNDYDVIEWEPDPEPPLRIVY